MYLMHSSKTLNVVLTVTVYGCLFRKNESNPKTNKHNKPSSNKSPRVKTLVVCLVVCPFKSSSHCLPLWLQLSYWQRRLSQHCINKANLFLNLFVLFGSLSLVVSNSNILETPVKLLGDPWLGAWGLGEALRLRTPGSPQLGGPSRLRRLGGLRSWLAQINSLG